MSQSDINLLLFKYRFMQFFCNIWITGQIIVKCVLKCMKGFGEFNEV
jgi:hypothetical protein